MNSDQYFNKIPVYSPKDSIAEQITVINAGLKGSSLFNLAKADLPIPPFFVIDPVIYTDYIKKVFASKIRAMSNSSSVDYEKLREIVISGDLDLDVQEYIYREYAKLSGISDAWVSVRSSVSYLGKPHISFSGIFDTVLNVKGFDDLFTAIKFVYASMFTESLTNYTASNEVDISSISLGIVVQKMVQPEVSGITITVDPVTDLPNKMSIEAVFGLGDVIGRGDITPDRYVVNKLTQSVEEKHVNPQEWMNIRKISRDKSFITDPFTHMEKVRLSSNWSHVPKLEDKDIIDIFKLSLLVEELNKIPQVIEWVWESGNIWILQSKNYYENSSKGYSYKKGSPTMLLEMIKSLLDASSIEDRALQQAIKQTIGEQNKENATTVTYQPIDYSILNNEKPKEIKKTPFDIFNLFKKNAISNQNSPETVVDDSIRNDPTPEVYVDLETEGKDILEEFNQLVEASKLKEANKVKEDQLLNQALTDEREIKKYSFQNTENLAGGHSMQTKPTLIGMGIGVSNGLIDGEVIRVEENDLPTNITKNSILLFDKYSLIFQPYIYMSGGVICETGSVSSDIATLCRELGIPSIIDAKGVFSKVHDGDWIRIDGSVGAIYKLERFVENREGLDWDSYRHTEASEKNTLTVKEIEDVVKEVDTVVEVEEKPLPDEINIHEWINYRNSGNAIKIPTATKLLQDFQTINNNPSQVDLTFVDGIFNVDVDEIIIANKLDIYRNKEESVQFLSKYIDNICDTLGPKEFVLLLGSKSYGEFTKNGITADSDLYKTSSGVSKMLMDTQYRNLVIDTIKRLKNIHKQKYLSIAVSGGADFISLQELKRLLSADSIRRSTNFNLYVFMDSVEDLILIKDTTAVGIDGVIIDAFSILSRYKRLYPSISDKVYDYVEKVLREGISDSLVAKVKPVVLCGDDNKILRLAIIGGAWGVILKSSINNSTRKSVSDIELELISKNMNKQS